MSIKNLACKKEVLKAGTSWRTGRRYVGVAENIKGFW
jgi:hypothetical protein